VRRYEPPTGGPLIVRAGDRRGPECGFAAVLSRSEIMRVTHPRLLVLALAVFAIGCSSSTEPVQSNVDAARRRWLSLDSQTYTFDLEMATSWTPRSGFYHVSVNNGQVASAFDPSGKPAPGFSTTIERIWEQILAARSNQMLNSVQFDFRGIPVESDMGPWPVDGGVHFSVRNFNPR
jgi:hypothetical protein